MNLFTLGTPDLGTADLKIFDLETPDLRTSDLGIPDLGTPDLEISDLGTSDLGTLDLDTDCYVALNRILSFLKKLLIWFFMLSTKSRVEKLLLSDIPAKKMKKTIKIDRIIFLIICFHRVLVTKQTT